MKELLRQRNGFFYGNETASGRESDNTIASWAIANVIESASANTNVNSRKLLVWSTHSNNATFQEVNANLVSNTWFVVLC